MDSNLIARRDAAFDRHSDILDRFPAKSGDAFAGGMAGVVAELRAVTEATGDGCDPLERGKAYRYLGDAYYDLGVSGQQAAAWREGAVAYLTAERLLAEGQSLIEQAKLDFNFGNTIAALAGGLDIGLFESAAERYQRAGASFRRNMLTHFVPVVEERIEILGPQLGFARAHAAMARDVGRLERLYGALQKAGPLERDKLTAEIRTSRQAVASTICALPDLVRQAKASFRHALGRGQISALQMAALDQAEASFEDAAKTARATADMGDAGDAATADPLFLMGELIQERLRSDAAGGSITTARAQHLGSLLQTFLTRAPKDHDSFDVARAKTAQMREVMVAVADALPSARWLTPPPLPGSRAERLLGVVGALKPFIVAEMLRAMLPPGEADRAMALFADASRLEADIRAAASDEARVGALEDWLWRLALDIQAFMRRYHILVARPNLPMLTRHAEVRSLFVSGGGTMRTAAAGLAAREGIVVRDRAEGMEVAEERWRQLLSASVCAFDIADADVKANIQATYELGLALAVGKPCVVAVRDISKVPFDIEQPVIVFDAAPDGNRERLTAAVYGALANITAGGRSMQIGDAGVQALDALAAQVAQGASPAMARVQIESARGNVGDAVALWGALEQIVGALGANGPALFRPQWAQGEEAEPGQRPRCFHVTPFHESFDGVRAALRGVCERAGWEYVRGDMGVSQRIMHRIWHGIGQASAVVVDVTGHNLNVGLELGLVHAVGKPYRLIGRDNVLEHRFPSIGKVHIYPYSEADPAEALPAIVEPLLAASR